MWWWFARVETKIDRLQVQIEDLVRRLNEIHKRLPDVKTNARLQ